MAGLPDYHELEESMGAAGRRSTLATASPQPELIQNQKSLGADPLRGFVLSNEPTAETRQHGLTYQWLHSLAVSPDL